MAFGFSLKVKGMQQPKDRRENGAHWIDFLFLPSATVCLIILLRWVSFPIALTASVVLNLLIFALFEPRKHGLKRFVLAIIAASLVAFLLGLIQHWFFRYL